MLRHLRTPQDGAQSTQMDGADLPRRVCDGWSHSEWEMREQQASSRKGRMGTRNRNRNRVEGMKTVALILIMASTAIGQAPTKTQEPGGRKVGPTQPQSSRQDEGKQKGDTVVYSVGGDVSMPVPIYKPEPSYTKKARKKKLQGTVVLWIVVDAQGNVTDERVVKPLGLGLDEKALETVRTWKFKPASRNGVPLPVRVVVEVSFKRW